jgi:hypothetical protein
MCIIANCITPCLILEMKADYILYKFNLKKIK